MTLEERINEGIEKALKEQEDKKVKKKKFKLPFGKKVKGARAKKNYITVIKINENLHLEFNVVRIENQTIMVDKIPRLATAQYIMYYKKMPFIILPSWSVEPLSPASHLKESLTDGSNTKGYAILLEKMQKEQLGAKKQISGIIKWVFGLGVAALIGYALISGGI